MRARKPKRPEKPRTPPAPIPAAAGGRSLWIVCAILAVWVVALLYARDRVPPGINSDASGEALGGIYLVEGHHWEVITFAVGNSAETLYLYLLGALIHVMGPITLALHLACWPFALATIWMVWKLTERIADSVPPWVPALTAAASLWLFHYARSGLRAITAPFFLAAFALLLDRVERRPRDRAAGLLCGAVLGLSLYGYTSARVLPIAFLVYALFRLRRERGERKPLLWRYGAVVAGTAAASIPNLLFFLQKPAAFLGRGSYVVTGGGIDHALHVVWTALMPWYYPGNYRVLEGPTYQSDGVSAALLATGQNPVNLVLAAAMLAGLWRARRWLHRPAAGFLLAAWISATLLLGIAGPSLTRTLIVLPIYLVLAALGFGYAMEALPRLRPVVPLVILAVAAMEGYSYFSSGAEQAEYYGAAATPMGQMAAAMASQGHRVLCIVSKNKGVVNLLTHGQEGRVGVAEFYRRPLDPSQLPIRELRPEVVLVEDTPAFRPFMAGLPQQNRTCQEEGFSCYSVPGM
jgi:hypothetical protein